MRSFAGRYHKNNAQPLQLLNIPNSGVLLSTCVGMIVLGMYGTVLFGYGGVDLGPPVM